MTARNDTETYNQPLGGNEMPRFAGPSTMFRLPSQTTAAGLDIAIPVFRSTLVPASDPVPASAPEGSEQNPS